MEGSRALEKVGCCEQRALKLLATHRATASALLDIIHRSQFQSQYRQETKTPNKSGGEEFSGVGSEDESQNSYKELTA